MRQIYIVVQRGQTLDTFAQKFHPGFPRWIGPAGPKAAEMLAKLPISSFTRQIRQNSAT